MQEELFVLNYLKEHNRGIHPKESRERLAASTARITLLLKHMEKQGAIVRFADANDSRQVAVQIAEEDTTEIDHIQCSFAGRCNGGAEIPRIYSRN